MKLSTAKKTADRVVELLGAHSDRIHIAGSISREKPEVGDIEIVCLPNKGFVQTDLFGSGNMQVVEGFNKALEAIEHQRVKGSTHGRYLQTVLKGGAVLDLFMPQEHDYYRQLAIRTGSREYSHYVIAKAWERKGWCGTHDGLRRQLDCTRNEKSGTWNCFNQNAELPPVWQSEEEFFTWLDISYLHPSLREVKSTLNIYL